MQQVHALILKVNFDSVYSLLTIALYLKTILQLLKTVASFLSGPISYLH